MWFHSRFSQKKKQAEINNSSSIFSPDALDPPPITIKAAEKEDKLSLLLGENKKNMQFIFLLFAFLANVSQAAQVDLYFSEESDKAYF